MIALDSGNIHCMSTKHCRENMKVRFHRSRIRPFVKRRGDGCGCWSD